MPVRVVLNVEGHPVLKTKEFLNSLLQNIKKFSQILQEYNYLLHFFCLNKIIIIILFMSYNAIIEIKKNKKRIICCIRLKDLTHPFRLHWNRRYIARGVETI